jgi:hypothetical protein
MFLTHPAASPVFGEQIETLAADHKPNLDLAQQTCRTPDRGQIKELLVRNILIAMTRSAIGQSLQPFRVTSSLDRNL